MKIKEFNKLLAYIDDNIADKKPLMTIYSKSCMFTKDYKDRLEGLKIDIIGNSLNVCLYWCYDKEATKYGFKYNKVKDFFNSSYTLTFNQKDKLLARLEYYRKKTSKII